MESTSKEYLHTLGSLRDELLAFKAEQNKLRFQISHIFEENKKLTNELRENVHMRYMQLSESDIGQLEQKLQAAVASKNAAIEMWQTALKQLEKQEELLLGKKSIIATERNEVEKHFLQMKEDYTKGVNILSSELSVTRSELSKYKNELDEKNYEFEKCKAELESVRKEFSMNKRELSELSDVNQQLEDKIISSQSIITESSKTLDALTKEISVLKAENRELSISISELKKENKKIKSEVLILEKDAKESLLTAQEAVLQKKEIVYREEQYQNEIEVLKSSIDLEIQKVGLRYKAEMKEFQKKAAEKTQNLISEIQQLHQEIGEKQNMFERANREKQALESKLELLFTENSSGMPTSASAFDDMCKRLTMAERARDEHELKVSSLEISLRELKSAKEQEVQYLLEKQKSLTERTQSLLKDFNQASCDRIKLSDEMTKLKRKCCELEKEVKNTRTKYVTDISTIEEESRNKLQMLQKQKHLTEEHYKNVCNELQKLLDAEFKISKRWKVEVENLISKSEAQIKELCQDIAYLKRNNSELVNILHQNNVRIPRDALYLTNVDTN